MELKTMICLIAMFLLLTNCERRNEGGKRSNEDIDAFYTESSGSDYIRFPLIKPYEMISLDDGETWSVEIKLKPKTISEINNPNNVREVCVVSKKELILLHSVGETVVKGKEVAEGWYVIDLKKLEVKSFLSEEDFSAYIKAEGIEPVEWYAAKESFKQFDKSSCLTWIENCKEKRTKEGLLI